MNDQIPDGEYEIDFSGVFAARQTDVFGIRYGFIPDTIDKGFKSLLYQQASETNSNDSDTMQCYLVSESKASEKAVTTNRHKNEQIFFEGHSASVNGNNADPGNFNEYLLAFDDVSKTFKVDPFNGFIKMTKSRDTSAIQGRISKIEKELAASKKSNQNNISQSCIDILLNRLQDTLKGNTSIAGAATSISTSSSTTPNSTLYHASQSTPPSSINNKLSRPQITKFENVLDKLSPMKKPKNINTTPSASNSPLGSPTTNNFNAKALQPSKSLSAKQNSPAYSSKPPSPLRTSTPWSPAQLKSVKNKSTLSAPSTPPSDLSPTTQTFANGGIGTKKSNKSSLLRKAERAIGMANRNRITKPKVQEPPPRIVDRRLSKSDSHKPTIPERRREIKEARMDQTSFELNITPPPSVVKPSKSINDGKSISLPLNESDVAEGEKSSSKSNKGKEASEEIIFSDKDLDDFAEELESEMDVAENNSSIPKEIHFHESDDDRTVRFPPKNGKLKATTTTTDTTTSPDIGKEMTPMIEDDFELELSDWDDAEVVDGNIMSEADELTAGNSDFNLIIEDDPVKMKKEYDQEMQARREKEREETLEFERRLKQKKLENEKANVGSSTKAKTPAKPKPNPKPKVSTKASKKPPTVSSLNAKSQSSGIERKKIASKSVVTPKTPATTASNDFDADLDAELEAELDKALEEDDMSEEE